MTFEMPFSNQMFSKRHIKTLANVGEPIATPSDCS